jgi:hypothetical protein
MIVRDEIKIFAVQAGKDGFEIIAKLGHAAGTLVVVNHIERLAESAAQAGWRA